MTTLEWKHRFLRLGSWLAAVALLIAIAAPSLHAADNSEDFDAYKIRVTGLWFYSNPTGHFQGENESGTIDLQTDVGFESYSTVAGKVDWKFTRKNHLYFVASAFDQTRSVTLNRTLVYQGQTFDVGLVTKSNLSANLFAPGYQYDITQRKREHIGIAVQINLFPVSASLSAAAQVTSDGVSHTAVSGRGSLLAPIPVAGPEFRFYLTNSPRLFVEGDLYGMYLFGYGNFLSSTGNLGFTLNRHLSIVGGYQLGTRLTVKDKSSERIGINLTQKGPIAGIKVSF